MLIENFGTTRLSGREKGSMCNRAPLAKMYTIYNQKTMGRYMVKSRNMTLRQIFTSIRQYREGLHQGLIEKCPHKLGIADFNHVPRTCISSIPPTRFSLQVIVTLKLYETSRKILKLLFGVIADWLHKRGMLPFTKKVL